MEFNILNLNILNLNNYNLNNYNLNNYNLNNYNLNNYNLKNYNLKNYNLNKTDLNNQDLNNISDIKNYDEEINKNEIHEIMNDNQVGLLNTIGVPIRARTNNQEHNIAGF